jgi:amino acid transporter
MVLAMTTDRQLPQIFGRVSKKGVPYVAVITVWLFWHLAYLSKYTLVHAKVNIQLRRYY